MVITMTRLLTLTVLTVALFLAQLAGAQQQDTPKDNMEMMQNMQGDTTMSGMQGMRKAALSKMCMKMCMNMIGRRHGHE